jgi:hypothetical protein
MTALALLLPVVPHAIRFVEGLFKPKIKAGPDKLATVIAQLRAILTEAVAKGVIPDEGKQPTDDALAGMVEAVFHDRGWEKSSQADPNILRIRDGESIFIEVRGVTRRDA